LKHNHREKIISPFKIAQHIQRLLRDLRPLPSQRANVLTTPVARATIEPSLRAVMRSSRARAWIPAHLIDSLLAADARRPL